MPISFGKLLYKPEFRKLFVKVPGNTWRAFPQYQDLGHYFIPLPASLPSLAGRGLGQLLGEGEVLYIDPFVSRKRGVLCNF